MTEHQVALIGGDGVGPEVVAVGARVLDALRETRGRPLRCESFELGAERYLRDGATFPDDVRDRLRTEFAAVLLGAVGDRRVPDNRHAHDILFGMRFGFDLYANIRPVQCLVDRLMPLARRTAGDCDFVVFRENTEGLYAGIGGTLKQGSPQEVAITEAVYTRHGVERIVRAAFDFARAARRRKVTLADKHNAMPHAHGLWLRVFREVAADYPDIEAEHLFVDALCFFVVQDPARFDVIVACNLFGDIITDLAAALQGGMGMAASANLRPGEPGHVALFEPVHGSAPDIAGKDRANPFATVLSVGMMMAHLGYPEDERLLREIVREALGSGNCTVDVGGALGTRAVGDWVVAQVRRAGG
ncbi:MAG: isocitrate/isopropylmalate dehydrogenase family protein [Polyangiales bacterium]|nr:isocitrate/isopropylmalate dehydrogenase family protein [Myxococcales bacterium]MCB9662116.1 isocitrate/isopropylmalate dehydrogenase family protein [Sandaracinaceae bacterium]